MTHTKAVCIELLMEIPRTRTKKLTVEVAEGRTLLRAAEILDPGDSE